MMLFYWRSRVILPVLLLLSIGSFFLTCSKLSAQENPPALASPSTPVPKASFENFWDACTASGCSIYPFDAKEWEARGESKDPPHFNACDPFTYNAITKPSNMLADLPDFLAYVGAEKKNFFIPITKDPEKVLQKGDILVFFRGTDPNSKSLYEHVTKNRWHAAIVGEDDQGLFRLDSPSNMSGRSFKSDAYHILRLRKYPPEIKSFQQLRDWQADPKKTQILLDWEKKREKRIEDVNVLVEMMRLSRYAYDGERVTEITKPDADLKKLKEDLLNGKCPPLYCSELPAMAYGLSGVKLPRASSLIESINRLEERVIEPKLQELRVQGKTDEHLERARKDFIEEGLKEIFNDATVLREFGASDTEMNRFRNTGEIPQSVQAIMNQYRLVLVTPKSLRAALGASFEKVYGGEKGVMIGPSDFFDTITDSETEFSYVGSYVGERISTTPQLGVGAEGGMGGGGVFRSLLLTEPKALFSEKLHQLRVYKISFSPDGTKIVTASFDNTAKILNLTTGEEKTIRHLHFVHSADFSPDGTKVVTASFDKTAKILNLANGEEKTIRREALVNSADFSPDGTKVVTASDGKTARILNLTTGEEKIIRHQGPVNSAEFSPDGTKVVTASSDGTAKILNLANGEEKTIQHQDWVNSADFSPDGTKVVTASYDKTARILNLTTGEEKIIRHQDPVNSADFSPDGTKVVTASYDKTAKILNLTTGEEKTIQHQDWVYSAEFSPDGRWVATADSSGGVHLFSLEDVNLSFFENRLREYNSDSFLEPSGQTRASLRRAELKMAFKKAKLLNQMTKDQAVKLMNEHIRRADYRGFIFGDQRTDTGPDSHIWGLINQVWPTPEPAPALTSPPNR